MATNVSFAGTSIQNATTLIYNIDHDQSPERNVTSLLTARSDGSKMVAAFFTKKVIKIEGKITGSSVANCDSLIDAFRALLANQEANLDIDYNGSTRRYLATAQTQVISRPPSANFATFSVDFLCSAAFGVDTSNTTLLGATVLTTTGVNTAITPAGSAPSQVPVITLVVNSGTGLTTKSITITNAATAVGITVTRTWSAADSLVIDTMNLSVKVNGTAVNYSGAFPSWPSSAGNIRYADTFTTRNVSLSAVYVKRWL